MKQLIVLFSFITLSLTATAQLPAEYDTPEKRAEKMTLEMEKALPLQPAQVDTIKALNLKYAQKVQEEVLDSDLSRFSMYKKGKRINEEKEKILKELLSEEQYKNYKKLKSEQSKKMIGKFFE